MKSILGIRVLDAHAHFMTYSTIQSMFDQNTSLDRLEKRAYKHTDMTQFQLPDKNIDTGKLWAEEMNKYGITAMGFMVDKNAMKEFNETRERYPGQFMGYLNIDPADPDVIGLVERAGRENYQGIKLYPSSWPKHRVTDPILFPIYDIAEKHDLLVICHFGITIGTRANLSNGNPLDIQVPAQEYPDLNFMIAHFGAGFFREVLMLMYQTHNVVMDTSGSNSWMTYLPYDLTITKIFERALKAGASCRVVFGTDSSFFPRGFRYNILEEQYKAVKSLLPQFNYTQDDVDLIFRDNILRLTGFRPRTTL